MPAYAADNTYETYNNYLTMDYVDTVGMTTTVSCEQTADPTPPTSGSTYASQSALRLHFGLGPSATIDQLEIRWPAGPKSTHQNIAADKLLILHEPPASPPR